MQSELSRFGKIHELTESGESSHRGKMASATRTAWNTDGLAKKMEDVVSRTSQSIGHSVGARVSVKGEALFSQ